MMQNLPRGSRGLTLIEVLIAIAMLAIISLLIYAATSRSFDINNKLSTESNDTMNIAIAMQTFEKDISQLFSPVVTLPKTNTGVSTAQPSQFWSAPLRADGMRRSRLIGSTDKLSFIALGHRRVIQEAAEGDFHRVSWSIEKVNNTYTLFRSVDPDAFVYNDNLGFRQQNTKIAILENLSSAKFMFFRRDREAWEDAWDSENQYAKPELRFPDLISIKMEVPDPINPAKSLSWETIARPILPLNEPTPANLNSTTTLGGGS